VGEADGDNEGRRVGAKAVYVGQIDGDTVGAFDGEDVGIGVGTLFLYVGGTVG